MSTKQCIYFLVIVVFALTLLGFGTSIINEYNSYQTGGGYQLEYIPGENTVEITVEKWSTPEDYAKAISRGIRDIERQHKIALITPSKIQVTFTTKP